MNPTDQQNLNLADPSTLDPYATAATNASNNASTYSQAGALLPSMLRDALTKKLSTDNPLIAQRSSDLANYMKSGTDENARIKNLEDSGQIFSPTTQLQLNGAARANALIPLTSDNYLLGLMTGSIPDIISAGTGAFSAATAAAQNAAQTAQQDYQNRLQRLNLQNDTATKAAALAAGNAPTPTIQEINGRKVLLTYDVHGNVINRVDLGSATSGTSASNDLSALVAAAMAGNKNPSEPKPSQPPMTMEQQQLFNKFVPSGKPPLSSFLSQ